MFPRNILECLKMLWSLGGIIKLPKKKNKTGRLEFLTSWELRIKLLKSAQLSAECSPTNRQIKKGYAFKTVFS